MPKLSRWAIKISLVHFALGIVLGAVMLAGKAGYWHLGILAHRLTHVHMMLFGWLVQFVVGVAYWLFPTFLTEPRRGRPRVAVASVVVLNVGVVCGTAGPWVPALGAWGWGLEAAGIVLFAVHAWPRVKGGRRGTVNE